MAPVLAVCTPKVLVPPGPPTVLYHISGFVHPSLYTALCKLGIYYNWGWCDGKIPALDLTTTSVVDWCPNH